MLGVVLAPLAALVALVGVDLWVYSDARRRAAGGRPVTFRAGSFAVETPEAWSVGVLLLFVVFLPLYLASRT